jgi:hypothetical protein
LNAEARRSLKIKIIKKEDHKKFEDYTFIDNNIELKKIYNENVAICLPFLLLLLMTKSTKSMYPS